MLQFDLNNFLIYFSLAWGTNIALNFLYVVKKYVPMASDYDYPADLNLSYKKKRLLGDSTTILGLLLSLSISVFLYFHDKNAPWFLIPILVYLGHAGGSFIKRRLNKRDGEFLVIIDHGDYMLITGGVFILFGYINLFFALTAVILTYILHPIFCFIAFKLKLRKNPF